ncbi:O-antigen ligase family protein [Candidatus Pelagibacter sp.]|nr:O-antigen ligase family protein [Candidatus Pelagibacter sp.]
MILLKNSIDNKICFKKNFFLFAFLIAFFSISTSLDNLKIMFEPTNQISYPQIVNFFRVFLNLSIFPVLIVMVMINFLKTDDNLYKYSNLLFFLALLYFLSQVPGLFYTLNEFENIIYIISALNILISMFLSTQFFSKKELLIYPYILFIIFSLVTLIFLIKDFERFIVHGYRFYGSYTSFFETNILRSSGISRMALVAVIFYIILFQNFINKSIFGKIPVYFFISAIYLYQSRTSLLLLIFFLIFNFFYDKKKRAEKALKFIVIPYFLIFMMVTALQSYTQFKVSNLDKLQVKKELERKTRVVDALTRNYETGSVLTSSGRIEDWTNLINIFNFKKNLFFGYGAQGDRFLIKQSASNGTLYAFASGGLIGLILFVGFSSIVLIKTIKLIFFKKNKDKILVFACVIILSIGLRSAVESSYSHFGIDFILFYMALMFLQKYDNV